MARYVNGGVRSISRRYCYDPCCPSGWRYMGEERTNPHSCPPGRPRPPWPRCCPDDSLPGPPIASVCNTTAYYRCPGNCDYPCVPLGCRVPRVDPDNCVWGRNCPSGRGCGNGRGCNNGCWCNNGWGWGPGCRRPYDRNGRGGLNRGYPRRRRANGR